MEHRASGLRGAVAIAFLGVLVIAALVSPVGAALNKNKVKNIATKTVNNLTYTESEADGRFINTGEKASDSELLDGVDSGGFIRPQGLVHVAVGPNEWVQQGPDSTAEPAYFNNRAGFGSTNNNDDQFLGATPAVPIALYGRSVQVVGFEFCYATVLSTTLEAISLQVISDTTGGDGNEVAEVTDGTPRTDDGCRLYSLTTPFTLIGVQFISLQARVDFDAGGVFTVGRSTLILEATSTPATPLARQGAVPLTTG